MENIKIFKCSLDVAGIYCKYRNSILKLLGIDPVIPKYYASADRPDVSDGIHQPSCQTCLTLNLSNNALQKFAAKTRKGFDMYRFTICRHRRISICLDLSTSFTLFESRTSYVLVLMLATRGLFLEVYIHHIYSTLKYTFLNSRYSLKCSYRVYQYSLYLYNIGKVGFLHKSGKNVM